MGIVDVFNKDDRVELKVNELIAYFRAEGRTNATNEVLLNGIRAHLPYSHILTMVGETDAIAPDDGKKIFSKKD